jgi:hypothetical protein
MACFHSYSFGNIMSIARQRPTATKVAGFHTWKDLGRRKKDDTDRNQTQDASAKPAPVLIGFCAVYVFDRLSRDLHPARLANMFRSLASRQACSSMAATTSSLNSLARCKAV